MKSSVNIKEVCQKAGRNKSPENLEIFKGTETDPMAFLKTCVRKEGIFFNDRIWAQIEKIVDSHAL